MILIDSFDKIPLLPLKDAVVFPKASASFKVGRDFSIKAVNRSMLDGHKRLVVAAQRDFGAEIPVPDDIYDVGTLCSIVQVVENPNGTFQVFLEGESRVVIEDISWNSYGNMDVKISTLEAKDSVASVANLRALLETALKELSETRNLPLDVLTDTFSIEDNELFADIISSGFVRMDLEDSQKLLETASLKKRYQMLLSYVKIEMELIKIESKIDLAVRKKIEAGQKQHYITEQINALKNELRGVDPEDDDDEDKELDAQIEAAQVPDYVKERLWEEYDRYEQIPPMSSESAVIKGYIDTILSLPWEKSSVLETDINVAESILEADHYGLEDVKKRILEYLAVIKLSDSLKAPIICLVGPPGVGKTSIASSIARATGRVFVRHSLGGVRDEAEIRGHRKTYIGAMPGKIIQSVKKAGVNNPLFLLDEIDKLGNDYKGDPASALLEVLDPEQNNTFMDNYLDLEFDLSNILFIATANDESAIPYALRDRLEIIRLDGYTSHEKKSIAAKYLVKKQLENNGLKGLRLSIGDDVILKIIDSYTSESGVRELERKIGDICRKIAFEKAKNDSNKKSYTITLKNLGSWLGPVVYSNDEDIEKEATVGIVNGLAWTASGGVLLKIETIKYPGTGNVKVTGSLGEVMKESIETAISFVKSLLPDMFPNVKNDVWKDNDIHIHFPEGAVPKDGPSAGIAISLAVISLVSETPVKPYIAMTGEVSLTGRALKIGGLKAKLMAAVKNGIKEVFIPEQNVGDLEKIPSEIKDALKITSVRHASEVLKNALEISSKKRKNESKPKSKQITTHKISEFV